MPKGFKGIRHYGLLGPAGKAAKLARARAALLVPASDPVVVESVAAFLRHIDRIDWVCRPHCTAGQHVPTAAIMPTRKFVPPLRGPP